ncbi:MAG: hypothetical protein WAU00_19190, partial [Caldilinea sp.]
MNEAAGTAIRTPPLSRQAQAVADALDWMQPGRQCYRQARQGSGMAALRHSGSRIAYSSVSHQRPLKYS